MSLMNTIFGTSLKSKLPTKEEALPGRTTSLAQSIAPTHFVLGSSIIPPFPAGLEEAVFGLGCFWGAERIFWKAEGVHTTAVGYAGGLTPNPTYEEVCSGRTGHTEVVRVVFSPHKTTYDALLKLFWESHDPTQGMRQGNDVGTQYRSAIYTTMASQVASVEASRLAYQQALLKRGFSGVTTEVTAAPTFYYAEEYHQQYLAKNPDGYCGIGGTGVSCPIGLGVGVS